MKQLNRVQRELGSARLRGPDPLGRPSEPELDNASEGRAYLFTSPCNADSRDSGSSACTPEHSSAQFGRHHTIDESYWSGDLVFSQVMGPVDATEDLRAFAEKRTTFVQDDKELK